MLKIGIIGCGQITKVRHAPEYFENPNCELSALYDADPARAKAISDLYGGVVYTDLTEFLHSDIDAVSVCVANNAHAEVSIAALKAGKHVLCEKPMAVTLLQCEEMVKAAKAADKNLMIAQNQRYNLSHIKVREMVKNGVIGKIISFRLTFGHSGPEGWTGNPNPWFFDKTKASFGALADLGIHKIDLLRFLTDDEITEVYAKMAAIDKKFPDGSPITVDDNAFFILNMKNGAVGNVNASWTFYGKEDNSTILYGTEGTIRIYDDPNYSVIVTHRDGSVENLNFDEMTTNEKQGSGNRENTGVIDAFISTILSSSKNYSEGEETLLSMKAVFAAEQSAKINKSVKI